MIIPLVTCDMILFILFSNPCNFSFILGNSRASFIRKQISRANSGKFVLQYEFTHITLQIGTPDVVVNPNYIGG